MTDSSLNEQVARRLGWIEDKPHGWIKPKPHKDGFLIGQPQLPNYVWDIRAAFEIVEYMYENGTSIILNGAYDDRNWECSWITGDIRYAGVADTAPRAIVMAFLKLQEGRC